MLQQYSLALLCLTLWRWEVMHFSGIASEGVVRGKQEYVYGEKQTATAAEKYLPNQLAHGRYSGVCSFKFE